jgi:hypothetical protein
MINKLSIGTTLHKFKGKKAKAHLFPGVSAYAR